MKKNTRSIAAMGLAVSILLSGMVLAAEEEGSVSGPFGPPPEGGSGHHLNRPPLHAGHLLGKTLHDNMALDVLVELTGNDAETVQATMEGRCIREVLSSYGIEKAVFKEAMDSKTEGLLSQASECGLISEQQASAILEAVENPGQQKPRGTRRY